MGRFSNHYKHRVGLLNEDSGIDIELFHNLSYNEWYKRYHPTGVISVSLKYDRDGFKLKRMLKLYAREEIYFNFPGRNCDHAWGKQLTSKFKFLSDFWWVCRKCGVSTKVIHIDYVSESLRNAYSEHLRT